MRFDKIWVSQSNSYRIPDRQLMFDKKTKNYSSQHALNSAFSLFSIFESENSHFGKFSNTVSQVTSFRKSGETMSSLLYHILSDSRDQSVLHFRSFWWALSYRLIIFYKVALSWKLLNPSCLFSTQHHHPSFEVILKALTSTFIRQFRCPEQSPVFRTAMNNRDSWSVLF